MSRQREVTALKSEIEALKKQVTTEQEGLAPRGLAGLWLVGDLGVQRGNLFVQASNLLNVRVAAHTHTLQLGFYIGPCSTRDLCLR